VLTVGLVRLAGAGLERAGLLGLAMFGLQASIGSLNDLLDVERDRGHKPGKPLPRGLLSIPIARAISAGSLGLGLLLSLAAGPAVLLVAIIGVGAGYAYDLRLKATAWSWLPFAIGLPLLPVYAWLGATGAIPPAFALLVPLAVLGGAALALANELADDERDRGVGVRTSVGALGPERAWRLGAGLQAGVSVIAAGSLLVTGAPVVALGAADGAIALLMVGLVLGRSQRPSTRERGWEVQAIGLGCLAIAWLGGLASRGLL
jgi:4-hydroxybenzoate polyprenyltransferase